MDQFTRGKNAAINSYEKSAQFRLVIVRLGASCSFEIITAKIMLSTLVTQNIRLRAANYDLIKVKFPKLII